MVDVPFPKEKNNSPLLDVKEQSICMSLVGRLLWAYLCIMIVTMTLVDPISTIRILS